jgi:hypothetical protein
MMLGAMLWLYFLPGGLITQVRHAVKTAEQWQQEAAPARACLPITLGKEQGRQ